jgi:hypothetical protein
MGLGRQLEEKIVRAREVLNSVRNAAMATVNEDGSPHNTPYYFMADDSLEHLYWVSFSETLHSQNVLRTGQIFVVLYEAAKSGGLYISADDVRITEGDELETALKIHNKCRARDGKESVEIKDYQGEKSQRMWVATTRQFWVNGTERGTDGRIIRDVRTEITKKDLLT